MTSQPIRNQVEDHLITPMCELQRDWARTETVQTVGEILFALEGR